jgi:predicted RND superfamily exporter protein
MRNWITWVVQKRLWVVIATFVITLLFLVPMSSLRVVIDPDEALPQTHPYIRTNNLVEIFFGNKLTSVIGIHFKNGSALETENLKKIERITAQIKNAPGVVQKSITSLTTSQTQFIQSSPRGPVTKTILEISPSDREKWVNQNTVYDGLLISKDRKTAQIVAEYKKVPGGFSVIQDSIQAAIEPEKDMNTEFWVGGVPTFLYLLEKFSQRMAFLFPLAILIIGLIHYEAFRTIQALILPLVTSFLSVLWALGFLSLSQQPVDVFNASTPILILAVAAGHAVQILKRYYEEFAKLKFKHSELEPAQLNQRAVIESLTAVGPVMVVACTVAALGFFSLIIFEIKSIRVFGVFTGAGILSALILELTFIPALRSMLKAPGEKEVRREKEVSFWDKVIDFLYRLVIDHRKKLFIFTGILTLFCIVGAMKVKVDNSQKSYFYGNIKERLDDDQLNLNMAGTNTLYVLLEAKDQNSLLQYPALHAMDQMHQYFYKDPSVGKVISLVDPVQRIHQAIFNDHPDAHIVPSDPRVLGSILTQMSSKGDWGSFITSDHSKSLIQVFLKRDQTDFVDHLAQGALSYAKSIFPPEIQASVGGGTTGGVALNEVMIREKILNILQIMGAVFLISSIAFRSLWAGLLICVPLIGALVANFGVMGALGIPLQIATALVSAMAVGIGADYGIYMSYRLREELSRPDVSEKMAFEKAFRSAGKATLFVSSAVAGGFGVLMLSWGFNVHMWMGFLIALAMFVSAMSALTVFPALILSIRPKYIFGDRVGRK